MLDKLIASSGGIRIAKVRSAVEAGAFCCEQSYQLLQFHNQCIYLLNINAVLICNNQNHFQASQLIPGITVLSV